MKNPATQPLPPVDTPTYKRIAHYAKVVGKPLDQTISKVINQWMDAFGEDRLLTFQEMAAKKRRKGKLLNFSGIVVIDNGISDGGIIELPAAAEAGV